MNRPMKSIVPLFVVVFFAGCSDDDDQNNNVNQNNNNNVTAYCGDGNVDGDEQCDEGTANSDTAADACRSNCRDAHCGDGVADTGEACDDGNLVETDGCISDCTLNVCGDGHVNETMDGSQPVEQCDDGNTVSGDGCRADCQQDETLCGDGGLNPGEECDEGGSNSDTVPNRCRRDCTLPYCGDGVADTDYDEECDEGSSNSDSVADACRTDCTNPGCGDGVIDSDEECEGTDFGGLDCTDDGYANPAGFVCDSSCDIDHAGCAAVCDNGIQEPGEQCDNGSGSGDGCSATCSQESGWICAVAIGVSSQCECLPYFQGSQCEHCVVYVDIDNVSGTEDGTSWATAFADIKSALSVAENTGNGLGCEVWVAEGTYYRGNRGTINLSYAVSLYGGFAGTETQRDQRDPETYVTILSGRQAQGVSTYTVPVVSIDGGDTTVSGFGIRDGVNPGGGSAGGGVSIQASGNVTLDRNVISNNNAGGGAGVRIYGSVNVTLSRLRIFENKNYIDSGGGVSVSSTSTVDIVNCLISDNLAHANGAGVAVEDDSVVSIQNSTIAANWIQMGMGAGVSLRSTATVSLQNSVIRLHGKAAVDTAALTTLTCVDSAVQQSGLGSCAVLDPIFVNAPHFVDAALGNNHTAQIWVQDDSMYAVGDYLVIDGDQTFRLVTGVAAGIVTFSPVVASMLMGTLEYEVQNWGSTLPGSAAYDLHLGSASSPAVDTANSSAPAEDLEFQTRVNGDGAGGDEPDMGCYEYVP